MQINLMPFKEDLASLESKDQPHYIRSSRKAIITKHLNLALSRVVVQKRGRARITVPPLVSMKTTWFFCEHKRWMPRRLLVTGIADGIRKLMTLLRRGGKGYADSPDLSWGLSIKRTSSLPTSTAVKLATKKK